MAGNSTCPHCGVRFQCGALASTPCACETPKLDAAVLAELRLCYTGCLCRACLVALATPIPAAAVGASDRPAP